MELIARSAMSEVMAREKGQEMSLASGGMAAEAKTLRPNPESTRQVRSSGRKSLLTVL